jgi:hypothetical protein
MHCKFLMRPLSLMRGLITLIEMIMSVMIRYFLVYI